MSENKYKPDEVVVDVWGDFAMFAPPESSAERVSYPVPTPSAMRNLLCAIYFKPTEFYYQITQIDIIKPGQMIPIMKNEIKNKVDRKKLLDGQDVSFRVDRPKQNKDDRGERTQRTYVYLKDVYYRIHAKIILRNDCENRVNIISITNQFIKRVEKGKCFHQPYFGTRECMAFFSSPDKTKKPIEQTKNFGIILYDVFDPRENIPLDTSNKKCTSKINVMFYFCLMKNGIIKVPPVESSEVMKIV